MPVMTIEKKKVPIKYRAFAKVVCCCDDMAEHLVNNARREMCFVGKDSDCVYANLGFYLHEWTFCPWCGQDWRKSPYKVEV